MKRLWLAQVWRARPWKALPIPCSLCLTKNYWIALQKPAKVSSPAWPLLGYLPRLSAEAQQSKAPMAHLINMPSQNKLLWGVTLVKPRSRSCPRGSKCSNGPPQLWIDPHLWG
jgi:hypothetical protein